MLMPGWEWVGASAGGSSYLNDVPDKIVLHTTEGNNSDGAIAAYRNQGSWPHFTLDYWRNRAIQHLDTDVAASALWNERGNNYEPNRSGAVIQVEICGFAALTGTYARPWYEWLASKLGQIARAHGIPARAMKCYGAGDGIVLASEDSPIRVDAATFNAWNGWLGHQHIGDGNDHWDPGRFLMDLLLTLIYGGGDIYDPLNGTWSKVGGDVEYLDPAVISGDGDLDANQAAQLAQVFNWMQQLCGWQAEVVTAPTGQIISVDASGKAVTGGMKVPSVFANVMEAATSVRPNGLGTLEQRIATQVAAIVPKPTGGGTAAIDDAAIQKLAAALSKTVEAAAATAAADIIRQLLVPKAA